LANRRCSSQIRQECCIICQQKF